MRALAIRRSLLSGFALVALVPAAASAADPPEPPPGHGPPSAGPIKGKPKIPLPPTAERERPPTRDKLEIGDRYFQDLAENARKQGYRVRHDVSRKTIRVDEQDGSLVQWFRRVRENEYAGVMGAPQSNECSDQKHTFWTGSTDVNNTQPATTYHSGNNLWQYVPRWTGNNPAYTYHHNYGSFRTWFNNRDTGWFDYSAHEYTWGRAANRCNWFGNDPNGNGASVPEPHRYAYSTWGGDTTQSGIAYYSGGQAQAENWAGTHDGANTVEAGDGARMTSCGCGGYMAFRLVGSVYDAQHLNPSGTRGVWRPRIVDADIVINGAERFSSDDYLYYIFTHETGHTFGAGHVYDTWYTSSPSLSSFLTMGYNSQIWTGRPGSADGAYLGLGDQFVTNRSYFGYD